MKDERVFIRISAEDKDKLKQDAERIGLTISSYLLMLWKKDQEDRYENIIKEVDELQETNGIFI